MKKCFYFSNWEEQKEVIISLDENILTIVKEGTVIYNIDNIVLYQSISSNPILAKLCELTGAKIYGDYVVFDIIGNVQNKDFIGGDVIYSNYHFQNKFMLDNESSIGAYIISDEKEPGHYSFQFNIFHEYSKFLRKEENKWEEGRKVLNI